MRDGNIILHEINLCIFKLKDNKSPGNDGLTREFNEVFQEDILEFLLEVFKEAVDLGRMPMSQGFISLAPKPGKDALKIENWGPITLISNDANLLALIFSQRLKPCLDTIIDNCQSGFMKGRHISNNICLVLDLTDYNELLSDNSFILSMDFH